MQEHVYLPLAWKSSTDQVLSKKEWREERSLLFICSKELRAGNEEYKIQERSKEKQEKSWEETTFLFPVIFTFTPSFSLFLVISWQKNYFLGVNMKDIHQRFFYRD